MQWNFDKSPQAGCLCSQSVLRGNPVLSVIHFSDDHTWAFLHDEAAPSDELTIAGMSEIIAQHPELADFSALPPGWIASRAGVDQEWKCLQQRDHEPEHSLN